MIKLKSILTEGNGDCYQAAGRLIMSKFRDDDNAKLVHGMVNGQGNLEGLRFGHAWIESGAKAFDYSNNNKFEVNKKAFYAIGGVKPNECKYYDGMKAVKWMLKTKHWGPWELSGATVKVPVPEGELQEDIPDTKGEIGKKKQRIPNNILDKLDD